MNNVSTCYRVYQQTLKLFHSATLLDTKYKLRKKKYFPTEQYHQQSQNDLQAHLQQLQQFQEIQHHQNFLRSEQNEGLVTSLSEQGL